MIVLTRSRGTPRSTASCTYSGPNRSMKASTPSGAACRSRSASPSPYSTGLDAVCAEPLGVTGGRDAQHPHTSQREELHRDTADSTGGRRDRHGLTCLRRNRVDRGVGRGADHVQRTGDLPTQLGRFVDQLVDRDVRVGGMARSLKAEPEHLVADGEIADPVADFDDDTGQVTALRRTGRWPGIARAARRCGCRPHRG